ncbi:hypothetical protein UY3_14136 [Chelonia mydas]|uniref:Uncharacterized protein n=1 Tax=Chelonia mydas TaxID=8469 RepID=M7B027_CHEMY|nr:hypothetical protein UY3_14136 [Chelonia mydas]
MPKCMSSLRVGLAGSNRPSGDRFIVSSLDKINRPPSSLPLTPVLQRRERCRQSQRGSGSSRLNAVETPRVMKRKALQPHELWYVNCKTGILLLTSQEFSKKYSSCAIFTPNVMPPESGQDWVNCNIVL